MQPTPVPDAVGNIAIWGSHEGVASKAGDMYVFGRSPLFRRWVAGLKSLGFPKQNLRSVPKDRTCPLQEVGGDGICGWINRHSHFPRHIYLHLPNEVAFWSHCPACGAVTPANRQGTLKRHAESCAKKSGIPFTELLRNAKNNGFLQ
jgi:hypothetical protein